MQRSTPELVAGPMALATAVRGDERRWGQALVLWDRAMCGLPEWNLRLVHARAALPAARFEHVDVANASAHEVTELADVLDGHSAVVAIGGGSLLDAVKLAAIRGPRGFRLDHVVQTGRSGLVVLSDRVHRPVSLMLAPTTTGTAAESSQVACVVTVRGKRLVHGAALAADVAVLDPVLSRGLPLLSLRLGLIETLLRVLGPYSAAPRSGVDAPMAWADRRAESLLETIGRLLAEVDGVRGETPDQLRLAAAEAASLTQLGQVNEGRDPFGWRLWFLANELAQELRVAKMPATLALLPAYWEQVLAGDRRFGVAEALARGWESVRRSGGSAMALPPGPVEGVRVLVDRWDLPVATLTGVTAGRVARSAAEAWGRGLPMLGAVTEDDVHRLLARAARPIPDGRCCGIRTRTNHRAMRTTCPECVRNRGVGGVADRAAAFLDAGEDQLASHLEKLPAHGSGSVGSISPHNAASGGRGCTAHGQPERSGT